MRILPAIILTPCAIITIYLVGILKFVKNHLSFIFTLIGVVIFMFIAFVLVASPLIRELVKVNTPYFATFTVLSLVPLYLVKKLGWYPESAKFSNWLILFLICGYYFMIFREPNIIGFFLDLFTNRLEAGELFSVFFGVIAYCGIFFFFYSLMSFFSAKKDNLFTLRVDPKSFIIWSLTYMVYLNAMTSILNPVFHRPL